MCGCLSRRCSFFRELHTRKQACGHRTSFCSRDMIHRLENVNGECCVLCLYR